MIISTINCPGDICHLTTQQRIRRNDYYIVFKEARIIEKSTFSFASSPHNSNSSIAFMESLQEHIKNNYANIIEVIFKNRENVLWEGETGSYCSGIITGPIESIIDLRKVVNSSAPSFGTHIKKESLVFID